MKKIFTFYIFLFFLSHTLLRAQQISSASVNPSQGVKQKVYLDNTPITSTEQINIEKTPGFAKFLQVITPEEFNTGKVLCYIVDANQSRVSDKLFKYLYEDGNVLKLYPNQNKIALLVNNNFDVALFEQNAKTINVELFKINQQNFIEGLAK